MAKKLDNGYHPTHEEISQRAYALFEQSGCVPGHDMENWLKAESELIEAHKHPSPAVSKAAGGSRPALRQNLSHR